MTNRRFGGVFRSLVRASFGVKNNGKEGERQGEKTASGAGGMGEVILAPMG